MLPRLPLLRAAQRRLTARAGPQSVGFLYGAYMEDFGYCVYAWFAGCCLAGLVRRSAISLGCVAAAASSPAACPASQICIPEWGFFNRDPEKWLDPKMLEAAAEKKAKAKKPKKTKDKKNR